jgi:hypothetical protein
MNGRTARHVTALLALAAAPLAGTPSQAEAASCTEQYLRCLNDAYDLVGSHPAEEMADIECGLEWIGCVARKFKFW